MKLKKYTKIKITANALVPRGAVQEKAIFKSMQDAGLYNDKDIRIQLSDITKSEENQEMYAIMFKVNQVDSQGCIVENVEVLKEASQDFMENGAKSLKIYHDGKFTDGAKYQQIFIVRENDTIFNKAEHLGALACVIKFSDKELFQKMKTEGWETSIEGQAEEVEIEKSDSWIEKIAKKVMEMLNIKKEVKEMNPEEVKALILETVTPLLNALKEEIKGKEPEPTKPDEEMAKSVTELKKEIIDLKKSNETIITELKKHGSSQAKEHEKIEDEKPKFKKGFLGNYQIKEKD